MPRMASLAMNIDREQLKNAVFEQNSPLFQDGVFMMKNGEVKCTCREDTGILCELISESELGRMLAEGALFSYTEAELSKWVDELDLSSLQAKVDAAAGQER